MMTKLELIKNTASIIVGVGTTKIVTAIIANNVPQEKLTDKVTVTGAGVVIGSMVADKTKEYTDAQIELAATWWKANIKK